MPNLAKDGEDKITIDVHVHHHHHYEKRNPPRHPSPPPPPAPTLKPRMVREGCAVYLLIGVVGLIGAALTIL